MRTVCEIMKSNVVTISLGNSVKDASRIMESFKIGCLPVMDETAKIVGIITSTDLRRVHPNRIVDDAMTPDPVVVTPETPIIKVTDLILERKIKHIPVVKNRRLKGIVSKSDVNWEIGKNTDSLTNLKQSALLKDDIEYLIERNLPFTVFFIDLDNFSLVNKKFGHVIGDDLLCAFSHNLQQKLLDVAQAHLYRYGGDEFAIILENNSFTDKIIDIIGETSKGTLLPDGKNIVASTGIVTCNQFNGLYGKIKNNNLCTEILNTASKASTKAKKVADKFILTEIK